MNHFTGSFDSKNIILTFHVTFLHKDEEIKRCIAHYLPVWQHIMPAIQSITTYISSSVCVYTYYISVCVCVCVHVCALLSEGYFNLTIYRSVSSFYELCK